MQKYRNEISVWNAQQNINSNCNAISFINVGGSIAIINQALPLAPGASISFSGNENEEDITQYSIFFVPGGANPAVMVTRKYFVEG